MDKKRLDIYLHENGFANSRNQASEMIKKNLVSINGIISNKPNKIVNEADIIEINQEWKYVSRAGYKLEQAINSFKLNFFNKVVLDIGSSTGGFVDCALQHGAQHIYALDVGTNQLDHKLIRNQKIKLLEQTNLKMIPNINFDKHIDIITCDVSFISLKYVFESIIKIVDKNTDIVLLIKPQFELDNVILKKQNFSIKNKKYLDMAINKVIQYANQNNYNLINIEQSNILGAKKSNIEYLSYFKLIK